jgi:hypothetical protein
MEGSTVVVAGLPAPSYYSAGGVWAAKAAFVGGQWWIAYYNGQKGIVLHPFASAERAFSILPIGDGWHAIGARSATVLRIAISRTPGEGPGDVWGYDIDVTTGVAVPLPFGTQSQEVVTLPFMLMSEINPAPPVTLPLFAFAHPVLVVPYKDPAGTSGAPAEILVNQNDQRVVRPLFVAEDTLASTWLGSLLGIYTEGANPAAAIAAATQRSTRVLWCQDNADLFSVPTGLRPYDIVLMQTYRYKEHGETLQQALARWRRDVTIMLQTWAGDCGIVPQFYCMGYPTEVLTVGEVLETQDYLSELVNTSARIKVIAPFAYQRANGITGHAELEQSYVNLLRAAPPGVVLLPVPPPVPPNPQPTTPYPAARPYTRTV